MTTNTGKSSAEKMDTRTYVPHPKVIAIEVEDGVVLLDLRTRQYFTLNETGAFIWQLLLEEQPADIIALRMSQVFAIGDEVATEAVGSLLEDLQEAALITSST